MTTHRYTSGRTAERVHAISAIQPVQPHRRGMQPPPNDPRELFRELIRIRWELRGLLMRRSQLALVMDRYDMKLVASRRQQDAYADALQACSPEDFARAESATEGWLDARGHVSAAIREGKEVE